MLRIPPLPRRRRPALLALCAAALAGCAQTAPDALRGDVAQLAAAHDPRGTLPPAATTRAQADALVAQWLAAPLDADSAVRIALLNNPALQAALSALDIADAERVQAATLPNPYFSIGRFTEGGARQIERSLRFDVLGLLTLPWRVQQQGRAVEIAKLQAAQDVVRLAAGTRRAWVRAVAAEQVAAAHGRMQDAAEAGAELARRMADAGNWSRLRQAREQMALAGSTARLARARLAAAQAREDLSRRMGLEGGEAQRFTLPDRLPDLPAAPPATDGLEARALRERLDVRAAQLQNAYVAESLGYTRATGFVSALDIGYTHDTTFANDGSGGGVAKRGWALDVPIPLFDWGGAATASAQARYRQSAEQVRDAAVLARSEVRAAAQAVRTAHALAHQQRQAVVPLAQRISDETTLRHGGMLASTWELLAEAAAATQAVADAAEAERDYWLADADLQQAITGTSPGAAQAFAAGAASNTPERH
ncbi:TolC family protein [Ramlibacter sp. H39-3-26]|uniref:TolC family protein n=1 Tax=Curvibacter soli TaxID=3031331 RepID=UPI0023DB7C1E|nr:TolC family protein [Ramlibacter sp. H39-3-26]MDF1485139.1 TolC family protein [Ramlibacter sp. H39-3-26]